MCLCLQLGEGMWGAQSTGVGWGVAWLEERSPDCLRWGPHQGNPSGTSQQAWGNGVQGWVRGFTGLGTQAQERGGVVTLCASILPLLLAGLSLWDLLSQPARPCPGGR